MRILKILSKFLVCILCACVLCAPSFAATNVPLGDIGEYGNWLTEDNLQTITTNMQGEATAFGEQFTTQSNSPGFVPIEARIGLMFMKALSSIDYVLQISLVRFTIIFLFLMYALWIGVEAYKMMRETSDYKKVLYDVFKKGIVIVIWVLILDYGPAKIFMDLMTPILSFSTYVSDFILDAVANDYSVNIQDTCTEIRRFVNQNAVTPVANNETAKLMLDPDVAANIMCLPGRLSVYFYHATGTAFKWFTWGFGIGHPTTAIVMGAICIIIFVKCIFKYAFMTLGVVASLFLTLLMLPFTALAEALPSSSEKSYVGKILNGFLSIFSAKKLSSVISVFIDAAIYFVSLAIVISICAALLGYILPVKNATPTYGLGPAMTTILCGCLVLYLANKADELAKKVGGSIDNSFGEKFKNDVKTLWKDTKDVTSKIYKDWTKKK